MRIAPGTAGRVLVVAALCGAVRAAAVDIQLTQFTDTSLERPVDIASAGDDRLFVVEKPGRIRIVESDGTVRATPFLDIDPLVGDASNEQGLLGLAFHPDYASNGFFFVNYTDTDGDTVVARFSVSANPDVADPDSGVPLLSVDQPFVNHNGGDLNFGPNDGYLYVALGDGGNGCDPGQRAQDPQELLGKILRLDVDSASPYAIPPSNPFAGSVTTREEIWAIGLRNPWRFSFDRANGNMYVGDVGQNAREEVDFQPASSDGGENYGWRCWEGTQFDTCNDGCSPTHVPPVHEYSHAGPPSRCSVTGGYVYRGSAYPDLTGHYFFADYCSSDFWSLTTPNNGGSWTLESHGQPVPGFAATTFGENTAGELFVADDGGFVYRLSGAVTVPDCPAIPDETCMATSKASVKAVHPSDDLRNKLVWKWVNGPELDQGAFGDPTAGTSLRLCVYGSGGLAIDAALPAGTSWSALPTGYRYRNAAGAGDGGAFKALLKGGVVGRSKLLVKARGSNLDLAGLPLGETNELRVQLFRSDAAACWEARYPADSIDADDGTQLKARIP
jgi:glucose/arabinose dehydrogenase